MVLKFLLTEPWEIKAEQSKRIVGIKAILAHQSRSGREN